VYARQRVHPRNSECGATQFTSGGEKNQTRALPQPYLSPTPYLPRSHSSPSQCISPATPPHAGTPSSESCQVSLWPLPQSEGSKTCRTCRHFPRPEDRLAELRTPRGQVHAMDGAGELYSGALGSSRLGCDHRWVQPDHQPPQAKAVGGCD
jgi:hypothetical protein